MPAIPRAPIRFGEIFKTTVWGGRKLQRLMGKNLPPHEPVGESWEISDHPHGQSVVAEGPLAGATLHDLVARDEAGLIGRKKALESGGRFPLIFKFIDASQAISVQVHPDDAYAREHENGEAGKSEAWYVVQSSPGAKIALGLKSGTTREDLAGAVRAGGVEKLLAFVDVRHGDALDIPAGTLHALGAGVLLAEIQQNSDTTYRVYDWGRVGLDGKPRELHVDKALDVVRFDDAPKHGPLVKPEILIRERPWHERLVANDKFTFDRWTATEPFELRPVELRSFIILSCTEGEAALVWDGGECPAGRGRTLLLPAAMKAVTIRPRGRVELLAMSLPLR